MRPTQVVVGRQPVFDVDLKVVGYELLFRDVASDNVADGGGRTGDEMTADVLYGALNIGLDRLVGDKTVFCNGDRGVLTGAVPIPLPPDRTIVEVLESVDVDPEIEAGCRALRAAGYRIALDDFVWFDGAERLLELASVVKVDVQQSGTEQALQLFDRCRPFGVQLLAEKVETTDQLALFRAHGFDLFQGFALARPTTLTGTSLEAPALGVLQTAAAVLDEASDLDDVEKIVRRDPALSLQLLNVATIGNLGETRRPVRTIRDALVLLGTQRLHSWITLLMLRSTRATTPDDLVTVLARARMCELLVEHRDRGSASFGFAAGMVSALDRLLGLPPQRLADQLPLDAQLLEAAFGHDSGMARLVHQVIEFESGGAESADEEFRDAAVSALNWALQSVEVLAAA